MSATQKWKGAIPNLNNKPERTKAKPKIDESKIGLLS